MRVFLSTFAFITFSFIVNASISEPMLPGALLQVENFFLHHILVAEKSSHKLYLFKNESGKPELIKTFQMATGKKSGNKLLQGDSRTPEGVYKFIDFISQEELLKRYGKEGEIYGVGAFVMNYPNPYDSTQGKTGGGIWLHSTNDETRIEKGLDSRGCIVASNTDLKEISKYLELNKTHVIVVQELTFLPESQWQKNRNVINSSIEGWLKAWREEDLDSYMSYYDSIHFNSNVNGNFKGFKNYKKAVFSNPGKPNINIRNISIIKSKDYLIAIFLQEYISGKINDTGVKTLYFRQDENYDWKIFAEDWSKYTGPGNELVAFTPSMRFFKEEKTGNN